MTGTNGTVVTIREEDLPDRLHEEALADDVDPVELFEERIQTVSEWSESVEDGDSRAAIAYAIEEIIRTADTVNGDKDAKIEGMTDSADVNESPRENERHDLREHTKIND